MKAPLIAVISVGIAAAAPAVAVSADNTETRAVLSGSAPVKTDPRQLLGPALSTKSTNQEIRHRRLIRRFLTMRNRANRLIARRDHRKPRVVDTARQVRWSNRGLARSIRILRKRIRRVRSALGDRRAGLTPAVRAILDRIAACESKGDPRAIGGGGAFRGKYQFTYGAWRSVGGKGDPASASETEQDRRAASLLNRSGTSPWPICG
jgi:transglycosylase-like protein